MRHLRNEGSILDAVLAALAAAIPNLLVFLTTVAATGIGGHLQHRRDLQKQAAADAAALERQARELEAEQQRLSARLEAERQLQEASFEEAERRERYERRRALCLKLYSLARALTDMTWAKTQEILAGTYAERLKRVMDEYDNRWAQAWDTVPEADLELEDADALWDRFSEARVLFYGIVYGMLLREENPMSFPPATRQAEEAKLNTAVKSIHAEIRRQLAELERRKLATAAAPGQPSASPP